MTISAIFLVTTLISVWLLILAFPLWEGVFVESFKAEYPFPDPANLAWGWGWESTVVPGLSLIGAAGLLWRIRPGFRRQAKEQ